MSSSPADAITDDWQPTRSSQTPSNPHQPSSAMPRNPDNLKSQPSLLRHSASRQIRATRTAAQPYPTQANHIIYTDDVSTKLSNRVRRKCYNCHTTNPSSWRRSDRTPGKVVCAFYILILSGLVLRPPWHLANGSHSYGMQLCNKCGLFERTRFHPHPVRNPRSASIKQSKPQHRNTPPPPPTTTDSSVVQPGGRWDAIGVPPIGAEGAQSACSDGQIASPSADGPTSPQQHFS